MNRGKKFLFYGILLILIASMITSSSNITAKAATSNDTYIGLSGYPTSTTQVQNIINAMTTNSLTIYRISFNPTWMSGRHPYHPEYIQYFLDHTPSNWVIIVDRNHIYPPTETGTSDFRANIDAARNSILQVAATWPNNPRVWIELANEYVSTDFHTIFQGLIDDVRNAGYSNTLVIDKWNTGWSSAVFNDPYDSVYVGMHFYFNTWSVSGAISQMNTALRLGLKLVNTEVGADYNEANSFTTTTVDELNSFLQQCADLGVSNTVWMNENLNNLPTYQSLGLIFPTTSEPSTPPSPTPTSSPTPTPTTSPNPTPTASPSPTPSPTPPSATNTVFQDDFESGSLTSWDRITTTSGESVTTDNNVPYQGNYHASFYTSGSSRGRENAYLTKDVNLQTAAATGYFYISPQSNTILEDNGDRAYFIRFSDGNGYIAWAGIKRQNNQNQWVLYTNGEKLSSAVPVTVDTYYSVSLQWDASKHTAGLYVNGEKILESSTNSYSTVTSVDMGIIYTYRVQNPLSIYGDSFSISSEPFAAPPSPTPTASPTPTPTASSSPTPSPTPPPATNTVFQDDFESGNLASWDRITTTSGESVTIDNNVPYQGIYDAVFYTSGSSRGRENAYLTKDVDLQTATATGYFYISSSQSNTILQDDSDRAYFIRFSDGNSYIAWAGIKRQNGVDKWILYTNGEQLSSAIPVTVDTYYSVSLHWDASKHLAELYVNGEKILEASASSYSTVTGVDMGIIYTYRVQNPLLIYGDNFSISS